MKVNNSSPLLAAVHAAQDKLSEANTAPLVADDYRRACMSPRSNKHRHDAITMGMERCARRARRGFAEGKKATGAAYAAAFPLAMSAAFVTAIPYLLGPIIGGITATEMEQRGKLKRTPRGVREDKVWRAVQDMTAALDKLMAPGAKFALQTGELSLEGAKAVSREARACSQEARIAAKSWPEGPPRDDFGGALDYLDSTLGRLDKKLAKWGQKLSISTPDGAVEPPASLPSTSATRVDT